MHLEGFLAQAFIYLLAAVVAVPVAARLGLGSVLGYLAAGMLIGPGVLRLIGREHESVMQFAEFGVVIMLFLIGLELRPARLWRLRGPIFGMGGIQVVVTSGVLAGMAFALGVNWKAALTLGLILSLSSTAIVLQTLAEKKWLETQAGQSSFAVLLFQDLAVIPMLALLPLLGSAAESGASHGHLRSLPGWAQALETLGAVAAIVVGGRYLLRPVFGFIAGVQLREIIVAFTLLLVVGIALLMEAVGLSAALGTFLAGVVLSESEFRHELEANLEPFKGLLLGVFFIAVGASVDFSLIAADPGRILALVLALFLTKAGLLYGLATAFKLPAADRWLFALGLAQGGEFAFVLAGFALAQNLLTPGVNAQLVAVVAITMAITPLGYLLYEKLIAPRYQKVAESGRPGEVPETPNPVIIAGCGRFGHVVGRMLIAQGVPVTLIDHDAEQIEIFRKLGIKVFYGDATRLDLLHAAGAARARLFVVALDDEEKSNRLATELQQHFPQLTILARAHSRQHAYELLRRGVTRFHRETLGSALDLSVEALRFLGFRAHAAQRAAQLFRQHDEATLRELAVHWDDRTKYMSVIKGYVEDADKAIRSDSRLGESGGDGAWDTDALRAEVDRLTNPTKAS